MPGEVVQCRELVPECRVQANVVVTRCTGLSVEFTQAINRCAGDVVIAQLDIVAVVGADLMVIDEDGFDHGQRFVEERVTRATAGVVAIIEPKAHAPAGLASFAVRLRAKLAGRVRLGGRFLLGAQRRCERGEQGG